VLVVGCNTFPSPTDSLWNPEESPGILGILGRIYVFLAHLERPKYIYLLIHILPIFSHTSNLVISFYYNFITILIYLMLHVF
jgi:hypothetical protein